MLLLTSSARDRPPGGESICSALLVAGALALSPFGAVAYTDFAWIARRHGITNRDKQFKMASEVIASIT